MSTTTDVLENQLDRLRTSSGAFAMVALDQRESLREMFPLLDDDRLVDDETLCAFKETAATILTPHATGVLLDHPLGVPGSSRPEFVAQDCGLILAADMLYSTRGAGVHSSSLDSRITIDLIHSTQAAAVKYLVIWRRGDDAFRADLDSFLRLADEAGVASFVEGIVRPPLDGAWESPQDRFDAIVEAAADLSRGATVYKAEVPGYLAGDLAAVTSESRRVTEAVAGPWVVLSNGIQREDFADAVANAVSGGASGFLAGRAIWSDTVAEDDQVAALTGRSVNRLTSLTTIVERIRESTAQGVES
jgi:sulfofructosephosphate aldolase